MRLPEFTAEASLGKIREGYLLASKALAATGSVVPQGLWVTPWGDIVYCYNEGGFSGCFTIHKAVNRLF